MAGYLSRTQGRGLGERDGLHPSGDRARLPNRLFLFGFSAKPAHEEHRNPASCRRPLPRPLLFSRLHPRARLPRFVAPPCFAADDVVHLTAPEGVVLVLLWPDLGLRLALHQGVRYLFRRDFSKHCWWTRQPRCPRWGLHFSCERRMGSGALLSPSSLR